MVTLAKLRQVIKDNGFVAREAQVIARGTPVAEPSNVTFEVSGTRERLIVSGPAEQVRDGWRLTIPSTK
jgi:hypothetical protein